MEKPQRSEEQMAVRRQLMERALQLDLEPQVLGDGRLDSNIIIVGQGPGVHEVQAKSPFVGPTGNLLWNTLRQHGVLRTDCYVTNVCKRQFSIDKRSDLGRDEWTKWYALLQWELSQLKSPKVILALGNNTLEALHNLHGITDYRGSVYPLDILGNDEVTRTVQVLYSFNPANILRNPEHEIVFQMDARRMGKLVKGDHDDWPVETRYDLTFNEALAEITRFKIENKPTAVDIELTGGELACVGLANDEHKATCINFRGQLENFYSVDEETHLLIALQDLYQSLHASDNMVLQHAPFDSGHSGVKDAIDMPVSYDTEIMHHTLYPTMPHNLGFLTSQYTTMPYYKGDYDEFKETGDVETFWKYNCLTGDTKVLYEDLTWRRLDGITPGDVLLSFEENGRARKLRRSTVSKIAGAIKPVYTVVLSNGETIRGTKDHKIVRRTSRGTEWVTIGKLVRGDKLPSLGRTWQKDDTFDGGWLSGIFDGEGTIGLSTAGAYPRMSFSQKEGLVLTRAKEILNKHRVKWRSTDKGSAHYVDIQGGLAGTLRTLGTFRPVRLMNNIMTTIGNGWLGYSTLPVAEVVAVYPSGEEAVYDITTSTGTFVANGVLVHNCKDVVATLAAFNRMKKELIDQKLWDFYNRHCKREANHLIRSYINGIATDREERERVARKLADEVNAAAERVYYLINLALPPNPGEAAYRPNLGSWQQLQRLFYTHLKLKDTKLGTDEDTRNRLIKDARTSLEAKEILVAINVWKSLAKFAGTYVELRLDADGRFRCVWKQAGVRSAPGRLSSAGSLWGTGMNGQNQPPAAKKFFIADPGCCFIYFDLKQAEAQVVAYRADIPSWKADFARARLDGSFDAHRSLAASMFNLPYEQVPKSDRNDDDTEYTIRYKAKRVRHGANYRMQPARLAETAGISFSEASLIHSLYHRTTPELRAWWREQEKVAKREREIWNALGRRYKILERLDGEDTLDSIIAFYPQSTIGDKVRSVWYQSEEDDRWDMSKARVVLNLHDALLAVATIPFAKTALSIMKAYAETPLLIENVYRTSRDMLSIGADTKMSSLEVTNKKGEIVHMDHFHRWSNLHDEYVDAATL